MLFVKIDVLLLLSAHFVHCSLIVIIRTTKLQVTQRTIERYMLGTTGKDRRRDGRIRQKAEVTDLLT